MIPILGGLLAFGSALAANPATPAPEAGAAPPIVLARHHHQHWRHHRWGRYAYRYYVPAPPPGADDPAVPPTGYAAPASGSGQPPPEAEVKAPASGASTATAPASAAGPKIRWVDPPSPVR